MTDTQICNLALGRLGEPAISDIAGTTTVPVLCTLFYAPTVQSLLREHRWNFATKRTILEPAWVTPSAIDDNTEFRLTKTAHGLTTGQRVTVQDSSNYPTINGTWRITVNASDLFSLNDSVFAGSGAVDCTYALAGYFDWAYSIALPADCLRALEDDRAESQMDARWIIESGRVLTDSDELEFRYIENVTDSTRFDSLFIEALVLTMAMRVGAALGAGQDKAGPLAAELLQVTAPLARRIDANEGQKRESMIPQQSKFVAARSGRV